MSQQSKQTNLTSTLGADLRVLRTTVTELLSPQIFGTTGEHLAPEDVLDLRSHGRGEMSGIYLIEADRINVRDKMINEKPCIVMGACLDRGQAGPPRDKRREVEDKVLLNFVRCTRPSWPKGVPVCMNTDRGERKHNQQLWRCAEIFGRFVWAAHLLLSCSSVCQGSPRNVGAHRVLGGTVAHKSSACLFRDVLRGTAVQRRRERRIRCVNNCDSPASGRAVFAFDAPRDWENECL